MRLSLQYLMATTRLRKTFPFPADNSEDEGLPQALDEEGCHSDNLQRHMAKDLPTEQEKLIAKLRTENEERNDQYTVSPVPQDLSYD